MKLWRCKLILCIQVSWPIGGKKSVLNLRVICIAYTTAQIDFQSVKHFSSAMCSAQLQ